MPIAPMPIMELSADDQLRLQIENTLGCAKLTTAYVGNIADGVTDELLKTMFSVCGPVKRWKRLLDATGTPKSFGFIEFVLAEGLSRLLRLLKDVPLLGKSLNIKTDDQTRDYMAKYQGAIKVYQARQPEAPQLAFTLEEDIRILEELNALFKRRNFTPAMQFIETKVQELTVGPSEEPAIVIEHPKSKSEEEGKPKEKIKKPSLTGWETAGYRDRERRWEIREANMAKTRAQDVEREMHREERDRIEREKLISWIKDFDDSAFFLLALDKLTLKDDRSVERRLASYNAPSFYMDREKWRERRYRDRRKQEEFDERDEIRERDRTEEDHSMKRSSSVVETKSKRPRPALVPINYTYDELIDVGHDAESAITKLAELKKNKVKNLIAMIPTEEADLFAWDMDWEMIEVEKIRGWIKKNVEAWPEVKEKAILSEDLELWVKDRLPPRQMLQNMDGLPNADLFMMRLWRFLVYETEATAYGLQ